MNRFLQIFALFCALLPQCLLAGVAPALVVCEEAGGAQALELALSDCCEVSAADPGPSEPSARERGSDCEGCADSALPFSLERDELKLPVALNAPALQANPAWSWQACAPPQRRLPTDPVPDTALQALRTVNVRC